MNKKSKIFLAGHKGLVGSAVYEILKYHNFKNIITVEKNKVDLRDYKKLTNFFKKKKIDYIIMAAARAGGILANSNHQQNFFFENIEIQNNLLKLALKKKVKRTIYLGTSCIYPKFAKNPIVEESLLTGKLEKTNQCYAIAKIAGIKLCEALYEDSKLDIVCLMPTNIYGINDNFDKLNGHVIPAMISKFVEAKKKKKKIVNLLGTGKPVREFLHASDLAKSILMILKVPKTKLIKVFGKKLPIINIGSGKHLTIKKLAELISKSIGFNGKIVFDKNFPDGTLKKNLNSSKIRKLGWKPSVSLEHGINEVLKTRMN